MCSAAAGGEREGEGHIFTQFDKASRGFTHSHGIVMGLMGAAAGGEREGWVSGVSGAWGRRDTMAARFGGKRRCI